MQDTKMSEWKRFILQLYIFINLFISPTLCSAQDFEMGLICNAKQNWSFTGSFCGSSQVTVFINICPLSCWENSVFLNGTHVQHDFLPVLRKITGTRARAHTSVFYELRRVGGDKGSDQLNTERRVNIKVKGKINTKSQRDPEEKVRFYHFLFCNIL